MRASENSNVPFIDGDDDFDFSEGLEKFDANAQQPVEVDFGIGQLMATNTLMVVQGFVAYFAYLFCYVRYEWTQVQPSLPIVGMVNGLLGTSFKAELSAYFLPYPFVLLVALCGFPLILLIIPLLPYIGIRHRVLAHSVSGRYVTDLVVPVVGLLLLGLIFGPLVSVAVYLPFSSYLLVSYCNEDGGVSDNRPMCYFAVANYLFSLLLIIFLIL